MTCYNSRERLPAYTVEYKKAWKEKNNKKHWNKNLYNLHRQNAQRFINAVLVKTKRGLKSAGLKVKKEALIISAPDQNQQTINDQERKTWKNG